MSEFGSWSSHIGSLLDDTQRNLLNSAAGPTSSADGGLSSLRSSLPAPVRSASPARDAFRKSTAASIDATLFHNTSELAAMAGNPTPSGVGGGRASSAVSRSLNFADSAAAALRASTFRSSTPTAGGYRPGSAWTTIGASRPVTPASIPPSSIGGYGGSSSTDYTGALASSLSSPSQLPPALEARLLTVDHELDRVRADLNARFDERLREFERREQNVLSEVRAELQVREQEQRKLARTELFQLRSEIQVLCQYYDGSCGWMIRIASS